MKPESWQKLVLPVSSHLINIWFKTCHIITKYETPPPPQAIYVGWHSILPAFLYLGQKKNMATMVSKSKDGDLITPFFKRLGFEVVRGSRYKGSTSALKGMLRVIKKGLNVGLAIDGSRGPARKPQGGAVFLAMYTGLPLIGVSVAYSHYITLPTWDKMEIPLPFSKMGIVFGTPIFFPSKMGKKNFQKKLLFVEEYMFKIHHLAKNLVNSPQDTASKFGLF